jgi:hypothetical protein
MPTHWHYHVLCATGSANKAAALKATGLWFLDDDATAGCTESPLRDLEAGGAQGGAGSAWQEAGRPAETGAAQQAGGKEASADALQAPGGPAGAGGLSTVRRARRLQGGPEALPAAAAAEGVLLGEQLGSTEQPGAVDGALARRPLQDGAEAGSAAGAAAASAPVAVPRCKPMHWRLPKQEGAFLKCDKKQLAFVYYPKYD